jgi:hypothetical protein
MPNISDSNSYLVLYLVIILVLLYAITFMSSYTCNISVETTENFVSLSAPPLTPNDFTVIGVGSGNQIYIQDVIGGKWFPNSPAIQNSQAIIDLYTSQTGVIYAIGTDNNIYSKQNLNASWQQLKIKSIEKGKPINNKWLSICVLNDNSSLLLCDSTYAVYIYNMANLEFGGFFGSGSICKMIQLQDNTFLGVGGGGCDTLYTMSSSTSNWVQASNSDVGIVSIAQTLNGQILGLKKDGYVYTKGGDWNTWNKTQMCCLTSIATYPLPPQNIIGYIRQGAFIDDASRTIPNYIGNFNTLPECISAAYSQGYNTIGYQNMTQCFGGTDSAYDKNGFQTDNTKSNSAYPGILTNIVYKINEELVTTNDPNEGEVFVYQECQFLGVGSKMVIGQYPMLDSPISIKSIKIGVNTKLTLYTQSNYQGVSGIFYGYSDTVNKDSTCINFIFLSAKIEKYPDATLSNPSQLTNQQLTTLWTNAGCKAESIGFTPAAITYWKGLKTVTDINADMKNWATISDETHKQGCYNLAPRSDVPLEGEVVLFENCNYTGKYKKYGMGNVAFVGNDFNDITSSIKIGPYTSLIIYTDMNFGGKSLTWKNDAESVFVISCLISNSFDNMLSSLKVSSSTAQVNNTLALQSNPVSVLGPYYMGPWNMSSFVDKSAQWIWWNQWCGGPKGYSACNGSAPIDSKAVRFQLLVNITGNRDIPVVIHVIADNAPQGSNFVKLNGKLIGQILDGGWITPPVNPNDLFLDFFKPHHLTPSTPTYTQITSSLSPGNNLLEFDVQNVGGSAGLLVSVINSNTGEIIANSGNGQWSWVDPDKIINVSEEKNVIYNETTKTEGEKQMTLNENSSMINNNNIIIHDTKTIGKNVSFSNLNELHKMTIGGTFRLSVNLKSVPPYIKGQQYKDGDTNLFYLSIEKIDPNCQVLNGSQCMNIYVDNKKCDNAVLSNVSKVNAYRLVLVSKAYVLDPNIPFGKNVDFTIVKVGEKHYIKNIQTGYMPKLFTNDFKQQLYGYMDENYLSNISSIKSNINKLCGVDKEIPKEAETESKNIGNVFNKAMGGLFGKQTTGPKPEQKFVNCSVNADGSMYMMTTTNLVESNPVKFILNKDGSVSIRLQAYNSYGNIDKTYSLVFCNFNINTYAFIEKLTNPLGTFLINMVCFDPDDKRQLPNNTLNFNFEISKYPDSYLKEKNIYNLNS